MEKAMSEIGIAASKAGQTLRDIIKSLDKIKSIEKPKNHKIPYKFHR